MLPVTTPQAIHRHRRNLFEIRQQVHYLSVACNHTSSTAPPPERLESQLHRRRWTIEVSECVMMEECLPWEMMFCRDFDDNDLKLKSVVFVLNLEKLL
ncbi:hypothetical protein QVD17_10282 [Tagetes erecta]|uniref:Uncharacterized protein n=1 Tax=Tagetes erecta TaxID=13708 RepID=A0AAD8L682_TARER|nr:hypothetical protein QVD17_10279 [Tagetes erecta]KAK1433370.1 hypothetical protein QVD17_10280 [Tagetes erecta]KAK1433371.1 hypothetical protein QVD17_10281 [Tagetes erecta]KAK1433372.1 hypothetical protein QVD17_10282 [Tagetes erecta]